jgi:sulfoxide reductase heme-binding subunit YedZ
MGPWCDYGGRFSYLKSAVFALLFVPGLLTAVDYASGNLGARPLNEAIHQIGLWAIRFLFIALAVTPLRQSLQWSQLIQVRRMIGVAAFAYAAIHLVLFCADEMFDLQKVATEIVVRMYLTIGFVALLGLSALAATSTDGMIRRLGGRRWRRLHQAVYGIALLAAIHFFLQSKADVSEPIMMAGLFAWLMGYRVLGWVSARGRRPSVLMVGALGLAAGLATFAGEALYYWLKTGVDPLWVLSASLTFAAGIRPGWIVLAATAAVTLAMALRGLLRSGVKLGTRAA